jgi:hypothetical protein
MTTEENNNPQSGNKNPNENPSPDNNSSPTKKSLDIQRSLQEIDLERRERDNQQRFGYFSVPYP